VSFQSFCIHNNLIIAHRYRIQNGLLFTRGSVLKQYQLRNVGKRDTIADKYFIGQIAKDKNSLGRLLFVVVICSSSGYNSLSIKANHHKLLFELP
jgi:hypothetical protein